MLKILTNFLKITFVYLLLINNTLSEIISDIKISGNERISTETIIVFSDLKINKEINKNDLNHIKKFIWHKFF